MRPIFQVILFTAPSFFTVLAVLAQGINTQAARQESKAVALQTEGQTLLSKPKKAPITKPAGPLAYQPAEKLVEVMIAGTSHGGGGVFVKDRDGS